MKTQRPCRLCKLFLLENRPTGEHQLLECMVRLLSCGDSMSKRSCFGTPFCSLTLEIRVYDPIVQTVYFSVHFIDDCLCHFLVDDLGDFCIHCTEIAWHARWKDFIECKCSNFSIEGAK